MNICILKPLISNYTYSYYGCPVGSIFKPTGDINREILRAGVVVRLIP